MTVSSANGKKGGRCHVRAYREMPKSRQNGAISKASGMQNYYRQFGLQKVNEQEAGARRAFQLNPEDALWSAAYKGCILPACSTSQTAQRRRQQKGSGSPLLLRPGKEPCKTPVCQRAETWGVSPLSPPYLAVKLEEKTRGQPSPWTFPLPEKGAPCASSSFSSSSSEITQPDKAVPG